MNDSTMTAHPHRHYLPAAGRDAFLPFYDWITKLLGADKARQVLLEQAALQPGQRILDIGCGTGTLAVHLKRHRPDLTVIGLDPDPKALARAQRKARQTGMSPQFDQGFADALPYASESFDHVFSSFMFHHLEKDQKELTLREVRRVLRPGAKLHLVDFSADGSSLARLFHIHRFEDNDEARVRRLMRKAGFADPKVVRRGTTLFGHAPVVYYNASA